MVIGTGVLAGSCRQTVSPLSFVAQRSPNPFRGKGQPVEPNAGGVVDGGGDGQRGGNEGHLGHAARLAALGLHLQSLCVHHACLVPLSPRCQMSHWIALDPVAINSLIGYNEGVWTAVPGSPKTRKQN